MDPSFLTKNSEYDLLTIKFDEVIDEPIVLLISPLIGLINELSCDNLLHIPECNQQLMYINKNCA